ncbi:hypothetical protein EPUL_000917, partial [Erysiphe pulchra]
MFQSTMNQGKHGLKSKNLHKRAVLANTPKKQNVVREQKNDTTRHAMNNGCKSSVVQDKWSALLNQHIEMLDSHIVFLDQSTKMVKSEKSNKLLDPGPEESISLRVICRVLDAALEVLIRSKEAAVGILPAYEPLDDKEPVKKGNKSQRHETVSRWDKDIASPRAADTISELDLSSIGSNDAGNQFDLRTMPNQPYIGMNKLCFSRKFKKPKIETTHTIRVEEQKDKNRTKVDVDRFKTTPSKSRIYDAKEVNNTGSGKKKKKRVQLVEPDQSRELPKTGSQRETKAILSMSESIDIDVDFAAIEIKLQEEIAAGERAAKEAQRSTAYTTLSSPASFDSRKKKRRRCSSDDLSRVRQVEKKLRRDELEKNFREKKRKVDEIEVDKEVNNYQRKKIRKIPK